MKLVALLSGGKDSCYNMMQCVAYLDCEIVAIANLCPPANQSDERDSMMYQTVGHSVIDLYGECLGGIPVYRQEISVRKEDDDQVWDAEVEDLYQLLSRVKSIHPDISGVSVGAILSSYQRVRVEQVCQKLSLTCYAYLWQRDQRELLREMIDFGMSSVLIKVASIGLDERHLGKSLVEMVEHLENLNEKYGVHICGEGGEYETLTLDCPLFKRKLVLDKVEQVIHSKDAFAPVVYLRVLEAHSEPKSENDVQWIENIRGSRSICRPQIHQSAATSVLVLDPIADLLDSSAQVASVGPWVSIGTCFAPLIHRLGSLEDEVIALMSLVQDLLASHQCNWSDTLFVQLFVADMSSFSKINSVYATFFGMNPPARACIQPFMPRDARVAMDVIALHSSVQRSTLHVQSVSHWAPANIGPYSQCKNALGVRLIAGQIALEPSTMTIAAPQDFESECWLSLKHVESVLKVTGYPCNSNLVLACCYVTSEFDIEKATKMWSEWSAKYNLRSSLDPIYVTVPRLPRNGLVEWQLTVCEPIIDEDGSNVSWDVKFQELIDVNDLENGLKIASLGIPRGYKPLIVRLFISSQNSKSFANDLKAAESAVKSIYPFEKPCLQIVKVIDSISKLALIAVKS